MASISHVRTSGMRVFFTIWAGQLVSKLGSGLTSFALGVWIYELTGSATLFAANMLLWALPTLLLLPVAGVLSDRWDRRMVMILSDTGAGLSSLFVLVVLMSGELQIWHVYVATFFNSAFGAFQFPALSAATSLMVPKEQLGRASGMTQANEAISQLAAPAIAGALFVSAGLYAVLLIDVATYLFAMLTLAWVRFPQPVHTPETHTARISFFKDMLYGWQFIRVRPGLFGLLIIFAGLNFLLNLIFPLLIPMLLDVASPDIAGYVESCAGVGMLAGTLLMAAWGGPKRRLYGIFLAEFLTGLSTVVMGLRPSIPLIAAGFFGILLWMPVSNGCSQAIWQTKVAPGVQGRVFSIRSTIAFSIIPLAYALSGPLADKVFKPWLSQAGPLASRIATVTGSGPGRHIGIMFVAAGILYTLASFLVLIFRPTRQVEIELPDAIELKDLTGL